jgi:pimeloyl-ACP methyl ester carboxylesterase
MTEADSLQTFVTSTDGTRISVTVTGRGRPLVLVHGSLSTAADWQRVADSLADHMTTYAIDRRGYGSSGDAARYSVERERDDVAAVLGSWPDPTPSCSGTPSAASSPAASP